MAGLTGVDLGSQLELGLGFGNPGEQSGLHLGKRSLEEEPDGLSMFYSPEFPMIEQATASTHQAPAEHQDHASPLCASPHGILTITREARPTLSPFYG